MPTDGTAPEGAPRSEAELDERLSRPAAPAIQALGACPGDVLVLGAGGKMGSSVAGMVRRVSDLAGDGRRVIAVSRFGSGDAAGRLRAGGPGRPGGARPPAGRA
jgi:hypothetical protein